MGQIPNPERLVFIDETWTKTNIAPLRGWWPRGRKLKAKVPYGHWTRDAACARVRKTVGLGGLVPAG
jgi:putative transposase